jgi:hypothetical protein
VLLVIAALLATPGVTHVAPRPRPALVPVAEAPLKLRGTHFAARERVRVRVTVGDETLSRRARAGRGGAFTVVFAGVNACDGVSGEATGSRGSRASFQFSSFAC